MQRFRPVVLPEEIFSHYSPETPAVVDAPNRCGGGDRVGAVEFAVDGEGDGADHVAFSDGGFQEGRNVGGADRLFILPEKERHIFRDNAVADQSLPVDDGELAGDVFARAQRHLFIIFHAVIHEFAGILPFVAAVGRPAAAEDHGDEQPVVGLHRAHEAVARLAGEAGLDADGARIGDQEGVFII